MLLKLFKDELDWLLQTLDIITPLGVNETVVWCNSFMLVPKVNGKVRLCLDPVRLHQALLQTQDGTTFQKDTVPDNTILHPIAFASKSLTGAEHRYSNIDREALGILLGLKKFHHYCFAREVHIITDHKLLVAIFKKMWQCYHNAFSVSY